MMQFGSSSLHRLFRLTVSRSYFSLSESFVGSNVSQRGSYDSSTAAVSFLLQYPAIDVLSLNGFPEFAE